jgi:DNA-binding NarL/FixJ family response regulator
VAALRAATGVFWPSFAITCPLIGHGKPASDRLALVAWGSSRRAIAEILEGADLHFDAFRDAEALLDRAERHSLSLILFWAGETTSSLPARIASLVQGFEQARVVVICTKIERWELRAALMAGAAGVVLSDSVDSALLPCLRAVEADQVCVPRGHWRQIDPPALSPREKQVLGLVVMGFMNSQIAEQLFLAESTVKSHLSSAFAKLGVRSRGEAVKLILDPERGFGMGILALGGEPVASTPPAPR